MQWLWISKYTIFLILLGFQNLWNLINVFINIFLWKCTFRCFLWFFKVRWVQENQSLTFLVVAPKNGVALKFIKTMPFYFFIVLLCRRFTNPSYMPSLLILQQLAFLIGLYSWIHHIVVVVEVWIIYETFDFPFE
jgi:hypothetical protein